MNVTLIPFFLAANIAVEEPSSWAHGAEATYHCTYNVTALENLIEPIATRISMLIKCRSGDDDSLTCVLRDVKCTATLPGIPERVYESMNNVSLPFRVNFDERGLQGFTVPGSMEDNWRIIALIMDMFNVGTDLSEILSLPAEFVSPENATYGLCATSFNVSGDPPRVIGHEGDEKMFDLRATSLSPELAVNGLEITKNRDPLQCDKSAEALNADEKLRINSCISRIYITDNGMFLSNRTMEHILLTKPIEPPVKVFIQSSIRLMSIDKAEGEIPAIENEKNVGIALDRFRDYL